jgi:MFS family permease
VDESTVPDALRETANDPVPSEPPPGPTRRSLRGLDWFVFFVADVQTGFGPFVAVYLTGQKWTQVDIGLILTVGGLVALAGQMPGGALVDAARSERRVAGFAIATIAIAALAYAAWPIFPVILAAAALHSAASCVLGPAVAAISLGLVGHAAVGERLGRNARFAAIGNGLAAAAMGACGYFLSARAVFFVTAALLAPALLVLRMISSQEIDAERAHGGPPAGAIDLTRGIPNIKRRGEYQETSAAAVIADLVVVGSSIADNDRVDSPSGAVRAFDARSGSLRWSWNPLPESLAPTGAGNAWSTISVDAERGLVFVPTGSASPDYHGFKRPGDNKWANSVVALSATTGALVWGFQLLHHDLWDTAPQPVLATLRRNGVATPVVIQGNKTGSYSCSIARPESRSSASKSARFRRATRSKPRRRSRSPSRRRRWCRNE